LGREAHFPDAAHAAELAAELGDRQERGRPRLARRDVGRRYGTTGRDGAIRSVHGYTSRARVRLRPPPAVASQSRQAAKSRIETCINVNAATTPGGANATLFSSSTASVRVLLLLSIADIGTSRM